MKILQRLALPLMGFFVGCFFFFPWNDVRDQISSAVQKQSGIQLQMQRFSPTTGLRLGLAKGSLLAFSAGKSSIRIPNKTPNTDDDYMIICNELIIGPRFWPLLMTQLQLSVGCLSEDGGALVALTSVSPFWAPSTLNENIELSDFSLENIDLKTNVSGILSGTLNATNINLAESSLPDVNWDLSGSKVRTPEANIPLLKIPSLDLGNLKTTGDLNARTVRISSLSFGSPESILEGDISFESTLAPDNYFPTDGKIQGKLRVDPSAEKGSLRDIPWRTFGTPDEKGQRNIQRSFTGGIQSLFLSFPGS